MRNNVARGFQPRNATLKGSRYEEERNIVLRVPCSAEVELDDQK